MYTGEISEGRYNASSDEVNQEIIDEAVKKGIEIKRGKIITSDVFDPYVDAKKFMKHFPKDDYVASEMEAFGLVYIANKLNKEAACLATVVDSPFEDKVVTPEDREKSLNDMITIALETIIK